MNNISPEILKNSLLQYIIDVIPQPVIWYNEELKDIFCNFAAEEIFQISNKKEFYKDNFVNFFNLSIENSPNASHHTDILAHQNIDYFKREIIAFNNQQSLTIKAIMLQRVIRSSDANPDLFHRDFFEKFHENSIKPLFLNITRWDHKDLDEHYRAAILASKIANKLELSDVTQNTVFYATFLMDIGTLYVSNEILNSPRNLSDIEFSIVQTHTETGYKILKNIPFETPIADIILQHHERFDGSGYPYGLREDEICLEARIIGVADTLIAMTSPRPHRASLSLEISLANLKKQSSIKFDARIIEACLNVVSENEDYFKKWLN